MGYTPENNPYIPGDPYSYDLKWMVQDIKHMEERFGELDDQVQEATDQADRATNEADRATDRANDSDGFALESEGYAKGTQSGTPVTSGSPYYEANAKYYSEEAADSAQAAADALADIGTATAGAVADWLALHVDPDTGYVIDKSLTIADAAADAEVVGDNFALVNPRVIGDKHTYWVINDTSLIQSYSGYGNNETLTFKLFDAPTELTRIRFYGHNINTGTFDQYPGAITAAGESVTLTTNTATYDYIRIFGEFSPAYNGTIDLYVQDKNASDYAIPELYTEVGNCQTQVDNLNADVFGYQKSFWCSSADTFHSWTHADGYVEVTLISWPAGAETLRFFAMSGGTPIGELTSPITAPGQTVTVRFDSGSYDSVRVWIHFTSFTAGAMLVNCVEDDTIRYDVNVLMKKPCYGKKLGCLGDSLTVGAGGTSWVTRMSELCGFKTVVNYGVTGSHIDTGADSFLNRYPSMDNDCDYVTILGGTNDAMWDNSTLADFKTSFDSLVSGMIAKYPTKKILGIIPPKYNYSASVAWNIVKANGLKAADYFDAEKEIFAKYCVPVLDLFTGAGFTPDIADQKTALITDGVHPTTTGNLQYLAPKIAAMLNSI